MAAMTEEDYHRLMGRDHFAMQEQQMQEQAPPLESTPPLRPRAIPSISEEEYNRLVSQSAMPMPAGLASPRATAVREVHFSGRVQVTSTAPGGTEGRDAHPGPGAPALLHFERQHQHFEGLAGGTVHRRSNSWGNSSWQPVSPPLGPTISRGAALSSGMSSALFEAAWLDQQAPLGTLPISPPIMPGGPTLLVPSMEYGIGAIGGAMEYAAEPFQMEYHAAEQFSPRRLAF